MSSPHTLQGAGATWFPAAPHQQQAGMREQLPSNQGAPAYHATVSTSLASASMQSAAMAEAHAMRSTGNAPGGGGHPQLPRISLPVVCGPISGLLHVHKGKILVDIGTPQEREVSATEFERLGGRGATKKWRQSIRLVNPDGEQRASSRPVPARM